MRRLRKTEQLGQGEGYEILDRIQATSFFRRSNMNGQASRKTDPF